MMSQARNVALGSRHAMAMPTAMVLSTTPAKMGSMPNRLPISFTWMSSGTFGPGLHRPGRSARAAG